MAIQLHPKIIELRQKASPISYSQSYVDGAGNLVLQDLKLKVLSEEDRIIEGYLSVFGVRDYGGEVTIKGCFAKSIKERGPKSKSNYKITLLWQHDMRDPIGQFIELKEDDYGLYFKAVLDEIPQADRALIQIKSGTINQFSFGYKYVWDKVEYDEETDSIMLLELQLWEGSVVTIGENPETYAIKSAEDFNTAKENLEFETEDFIKSLPRTKQLELRQLITKHITLATTQPISAREALRGKSKPEGVLEIGNLKLNMAEFRK